MLVSTKNFIGKLKEGPGPGPGQDRTGPGQDQDQGPGWCRVSGISSKTVDIGHLLPVIITTQAAAESQWELQKLREETSA